VLPLAPLSAPPLLDAGSGAAAPAGLEKLARSLHMLQRELGGGGRDDGARPRRALLSVGAAPGAAQLEAALLARGRVLVVALADSGGGDRDAADAFIEAVAAAAEAALSAGEDAAEACAPLVLRMRGEGSI